MKESVSFFAVILSAAKDLSICFLLVLVIPPSAAYAQPPPGTRPPESATTVSALEQAEDAIASQHYDQAKTLLLAITTADTKNARAFYDLGFTDEALHDNTAAEAAYRAAIAADPKNFEAHSALGMLLIDEDHTASIAELTTATTLTPATNAANAKGDVLRALAHLHADRDPQDATTELAAAIKLTSETKDDTLLAAYIAGVLGDIDDSEATYRKVLAAYPSDPSASYSLAGLLIHQQKYTEAEALLQAALGSDHADYDVLLKPQLARVYMLEGADAKAIPLLEAVHTQHPKDVAITRMLADVYNSSSDAIHADALYQQLLAQTPNDIELLSARGDALIRQKKFPEAEAVLQEADTLFLAKPATLPAIDDRVQLTGSLAFAASQNNHSELVLTALDQRIQYAPETAPTLFLRATAHDHLHQVPLARQFYTQFIAAAGDKYPNETWEAKHRLIALKTEK